MKLSTSSTVPVYTIAGSTTARPLPEWLVRKRKRSLKQDPEFANRIELLQDFEFEEASACVRVSEDGDWVMSTGTYKPQIHTHYLPHLSLSFARHTNALNHTFVLLSSDYSKSLHLQTDRLLELHTPSGLHYATRIPRYGRDLQYNRRTAEALIPAVGVNANGSGEVFRLNLEIGRFAKGFEVDVGGDDFESRGGGALQGGIRTGAVNCASLAEESHGLLAFGTSMGTVELWDSRSRNRVSAISISPPPLLSDSAVRREITALDFHPSGLQLAAGTGTGLIQTYDLRSPTPLFSKEQGYDYPIQTLKYLSSPSASSSSSVVDSAKLLSADKRALKLWHVDTGEYWTSVEPAVDLHHVEWVPDSGMFLTANEGRQQHAFFIPQLGPAPKWCAFLDNLVEEMAEDAEDPNAFKSQNGIASGEVYDNYKFLDMKQLRELSLDHLVGQTSLLRPYMHGHFVAQKLYEQARLLTNPDLVEEQRQKSIRERIEKERESRIRGNKKVAVRVNRRLAEKLVAREEANERRKAMRVLRLGGDEPKSTKTGEELNGEGKMPSTTKKATTDLMDDDRFKRLFEDEDYEIDETSREYALHNPSSAPEGRSQVGEKRRRLTAAEEDELNDHNHDSNADEVEDDEIDSVDDLERADEAALRARQRPSRDAEKAGSSGRIGSSSYKHIGKPNKFKPKMEVSSSSQSAKRMRARQNRSFGDLANTLPARERTGRAEGTGRAVGEKKLSFVPQHKARNTEWQTDGRDGDGGRKVGRGRERRSASGNVMRQL